MKQKLNVLLADDHKLLRTGLKLLLQRNPDPSEREIREGLVGNLCRCTGYVRIIDAVREAGRLQRANALQSSNS